MGHVTRGNVFEDLGFTPEESERFAMQVFLSDQIRTFIERHNLKQQDAADFFGVAQPKISKIMNEDLEGMSIDYLIRLLAHTGGTFQYSFRQPRRMSKKKLTERLASAR